MKVNKKLFSGLFLFFFLLLFFLVFSGQTEFIPEMAYLPPSIEFPFGTDSFGRNLLSLVCSGGLISLFIGLCVSLLSLVFGLLLSLLMLVNGVVGSFFKMVCNAVKSIPAILFALFLSALFGPGVFLVILSLTLSHIPNIAYTGYLRLKVLSKKDFILALESQGVKKWRIVICHYIPHIIAELTSQAVAVFSSSILTEASLSFLGCGIPAYLPSIGSILSEGRKVMLTSFHMVLFPSMVLFFLALSLILIQEGSKFDPSS